MRPPAAESARFSGMAKSEKQALRLQVHLLDSELVVEPSASKKRDYRARFARTERTAATSAPSGASYSCTCVGSGSVKPNWRRAITSMRIGLRSPAISNFKDEFSEAASAC